MNEFSWNFWQVISWDGTKYDRLHFGSDPDMDVGIFAWK